MDTQPNSPRRADSGDETELDDDEHVFHQDTLERKPQSSIITEPTPVVSPPRLTDRDRSETPTQLAPIEALRTCLRVICPGDDWHRTRKCVIASCLLFTVGFGLLLLALELYVRV